MASKSTKEVLFNDGEGLTHGDLNNAQRFINSLISDGAIGGRAHFDAETSIVPEVSGTFGVYVPGHGGAIYRSGTEREVLVEDGWIAVPTDGAVITGDDPFVRVCYIDSTNKSSAEGVRPAAAAGNSRWDILSVSLAAVEGDSETRDFKDGTTGALTTPSTDKRRSFEPTFTWTTGIESAGTPSLPFGLVPAGDRVLGAVLVQETGNPFDLGAGDMRDYRIPLGLTAFHQLAVGAGDLLVGATSTRTNTGFGIGEPWVRLTAPNVNDEAHLFFECPVSSPLHRVKKVTFAADLAGGSSMALTLERFGTSLAVLDTIGLGVILGGGQSVLSFDLDGTTNPPLWTNGYAAGYAAEEAVIGRLNIFARWKLVEPAGGTPADVGWFRWEIWGQ